MKRVIVVFRSHLSLDKYPAIQSIMRILINLDYAVLFIGGYSEQGQKKEFEDKGVKFYPISVKPTNRFSKFFFYQKTGRQVMNYIKELNLCKSDILLIAESNTINCHNLCQFGKLTEHYNVVFRLSESLNPNLPFLLKVLYGRINVSQILNTAKAVICCEYNRAHILKGMCDLKKLPYVLPNKPFVDESLFEFIPDNVKNIVDYIKKKAGCKKILLYQGVFIKERRLDEFCEAVNELSDYVFVIMTKDSVSLREFKNKYMNDRILFVPFVNPPYHLCITRLASIGILTYVPMPNDIYQVTNVLYCAPNKIFEYGMFSIPLIANDLPALQAVFNNYHAGECVDLPFSKDEIKKAILTISSKYDIYSQGSRRYYDSVNVVEIVKRIFNNVD